MTMLVLSDGRGARIAGWALRALVRHAADALRSQPGHANLADRLTHRLSSVELRGHLDTRGLPASEQVALESAFLETVERLRAAPAGDLGDPATYAGFMELAERVAALVESIRRGEPPTALNDLAAVVTGAPLPLGHDMPEDA